jgi:hypothetical protein
LNESSDVKDLEQKIAHVKEQLEEANKEVEAKAEATKLVESKLNVANDKYARKESMDTLLKPLAKGKKRNNGGFTRKCKNRKPREAI